MSADKCLEYDLVDDGYLDTVIDVSCPTCGKLGTIRLSESDVSEYRNPDTGELTGLGNLFDSLDARTDTWECACTVEDLL